MNTKLHAICDSQGRPLNLFVTAGQVSDYIGARALLSSLPEVDWLLGDRGYDTDWFRDALKDKGIRACIPGGKQRTTKVKYDKRRYKRRNRIEIMFGRLKDWKRVATRYDRCPKLFLSAIALAATVVYWFNPDPKPPCSDQGVRSKWGPVHAGITTGGNIDFDMYTLVPTINRSKEWEVQP